MQEGFLIYRGIEISETGNIVWDGYVVYDSSSGETHLDRTRFCPDLGDVAHEVRDLSGNSGIRGVSFPDNSSIITEGGRYLLLEPLDRIDIENVRADLTDVCYNIRPELYRRDIEHPISYERG